MTSRLNECQIKKMNQKKCGMLPNIFIAKLPLNSLYANDSPNSHSLHHSSSARNGKYHLVHSKKDNKNKDDLSLMDKVKNMIMTNKAYSIAILTGILGLGAYFYISNKSKSIKEFLEKYDIVKKKEDKDDSKHDHKDKKNHHKEEKRKKYGHVDHKNYHTKKDKESNKYDNYDNVDTKYSHKKYNKAHDDEYKDTYGETKYSSHEKFDHYGNETPSYHHDTYDHGSYGNHHTSTYSSHYDEDEYEKKHVHFDEKYNNGGKLRPYQPMESSYKEEIKKRIDNIEGYEV